MSLWWKKQVQRKEGCLSITDAKRGPRERDGDENDCLTLSPFQEPGPFKCVGSLNPDTALSKRPCSYLGFIDKEKSYFVLITESRFPLKPS